MAESEEEDESEENDVVEEDDSAGEALLFEGGGGEGSGVVDYCWGQSDGSRGVGFAACAGEGGHGEKGEGKGKPKVLDRRAGVKEEGKARNGLKKEQIPSK